MVRHRAVKILDLNHMYAEQQGPVSAGPGCVIALQIHGNKERCLGHIETS